jgi:hypothetical protein
MDYSPLSARASIALRIASGSFGQGARTDRQCWRGHVRLPEAFDREAPSASIDSRW